MFHVSRHPSRFFRPLSPFLVSLTWLLSSLIVPLPFRLSPLSFSFPFRLCLLKVFFFMFRCRPVCCLTDRPPKLWSRCDMCAFYKLYILELSLLALVLCCPMSIWLSLCADFFPSSH